MEFLEVRTRKTLSEYKDSILLADVVLRLRLMA